jgi:hypothetical protein
MVVVGNILAVVATFTANSDNHYVEWVGALAVLLTFGHVQVADRLAERAAQDEQLGQVTVECHNMAVNYLVHKEVCWLIYFLVLGAYSALVGVGVFLLYPFWRRFYRKRRPLGRDEAV